MNHSHVKNQSTPFVKFLETKQRRTLAYCLSEGALPGVVFLSGFKSDMSGTKAMALERYCRERGQRFVRFDYSGHGQSSGDFTQGTIGAWKNDALAILDDVAIGENILVGSSMGGWIMLLVALARKEKIKALLGLASAPDFTEMLLWDQMTPEQKQQLEAQGVVHVPSCYGQEPYSITRQLVEEGRAHLLLGQPIALDIPVRLIHGLEDDDVPWSVSASLLESIENQDVTLTLVKAAGHRLSEPDELQLVVQQLEALFFTLQDKAAEA